MRSARVVLVVAAVLLGACSRRFEGHGRLVAVVESQDEGAALLAIADGSR